MTAQEEPGVHHRSPAAEPASGERTARVSTLDVRSKERESEGQAKPIDFVTVAMFIIDDIEFLPPKPPACNVPGGAGTYAALGARLVSPGPHSSSVGWIVDMGSDFPSGVTTLINSWQTSAVFRKDPDRLTTRAWNGYGAGEKRDFAYLTPKRRLNADDIPPSLLSSKSFHMVCSPARCQEIVADLTRLRKDAMPPDEYARPFIIWEPVPDKCTPDELLACTNTLPVVAHEAGQLGVVGAADVDDGEGVCAGEELVGGALVWHGLPYDEGPRVLVGRHEALPQLGEVGYDLLAPDRGAHQVEGLGGEEVRGDVVGVQAALGGDVLEVPLLGGAVAVPGAGGEAVRVRAEDGRGLPGVDESDEVRGEIGADVHDPADRG